MRLFERSDRKWLFKVIHALISFPVRRRDSKRDLWDDACQDELAVLPIGFMEQMWNKFRFPAEPSSAPFFLHVWESEVELMWSTSWGIWSSVSWWVPAAFLWPQEPPPSLLQRFDPPQSRNTLAFEEMEGSPNGSRMLLDSLLILTDPNASNKAESRVSALSDTFRTWNNTTLHLCWLGLSLSLIIPHFQLLQPHLHNLQTLITFFWIHHKCFTFRQENISFQLLNTINHKKKQHNLINAASNLPD